MTSADIDRARALLATHLQPTRLVPAASLGRLRGAPVWLKLESDLPTGSFKPRGALYALSRAVERGPVREVVAASTGNHGAAVAYAARLMGLAATVVLPVRPNPVKRARILDLGARAVETGAADLTDAIAYATAYAQAEEGRFFLNDASDPDLPAGPATIAYEALDQAPDAATIVVPMGDTALIRGVAFAAKQWCLQKGRPAIRVVGVQAANAPAYARSWAAKTPIDTETCETMADGLATRTTVPANVQAIVDLVDDVRLVSEDEMLGAIRHLLFHEQIVAEPSGAASTAAFLQDPAAFAPPVVLVMSGANVTPDILRRAVLSGD